MSLYIDVNTMKATLDMTGESYADADIGMACTAASSAIDAYSNTRFFATSETRYYTPLDAITDLVIDDFGGSTVGVSVDVDGDGTYETAWASGTDFYLEPANADLEGKPFNRLVIRAISGRSFPTWQRAVKVQGAFGWAATPPQVQQAAKILAARYLKRARETPYGILTIVGDGVQAARLGKIDPDVAFLLDNLNADVARHLI